MPPAPYIASGDSDSDACHAIVAVQAQGGPSSADLEKVTAKTFFDIQIDGKPAGSYMNAYIVTISPEHAI
jgi:hypothetical protein